MFSRRGCPRVPGGEEEAQGEARQEKREGGREAPPPAERPGAQSRRTDAPRVRPHLKNELARVIDPSWLFTRAMHAICSFFFLPGLVRETTTQ